MQRSLDGIASAQRQPRLPEVYCREVRIAPAQDDTDALAGAANAAGAEVCGEHGCQADGAARLHDNLRTDRHPDINCISKHHQQYPTIKRRVRVEW